MSKSWLLMNSKTTEGTINFHRNVEKLKVNDSTSDSDVLLGNLPHDIWFYADLKVK